MHRRCRYATLREVFAVTAGSPSSRPAGLLALSIDGQSACGAKITSLRMDPQRYRCVSRQGVAAEPLWCACCKRLPVLLSGLKKRWPVLTTVVAGLIWLMNNYDIRGLDGLRIEPRTSAPSQDLGYGGSPFGLPTSFPSGPALPGTNPAGGFPTSGFGLDPNFGAQPVPPAGAGASPFSTQGYAAGYPSTNPSPALPSTSPAPIGAAANSGARAAIGLGNALLNGPVAGPGVLGGQEWEQLLSVGEKLGMLERTRQAVPSAAPVIPNTIDYQFHRCASAAAHDATSRYHSNCQL